MRALLVCPVCHGALDWREDEARCACGGRFPVRDGIPQLLPDASRADPHKAAQAAGYDGAGTPAHEAARPRGAPALHGALLAERLRRLTDGLEHVLPGATAVAVCGGSGMDAEWLARLGARVIAVDVSHAAARLAAERFAAGGLAALSVVGDAERLPLPVGGVDAAVVLDGLHHLADPLAGLAELIRVGRRTVAVGEPAAAGLTRAAVRLGLADDVEAAGNAVARLDPSSALAALRAAGFAEVRVDRYAMHYDPGVGPVARALSRRRVRGPAERAALALAAAGSRLGNKVAIRATR